jgi:plasmid segregation protein ParM
MNIGLDIGYSAVKAISGDRRVTFPSVVGTPDKASFSLNGNTNILLVAPNHVQIGEGAVRQSRFAHHREDRRWVEGEEWYTLFLAAMTEITGAKLAELNIVTGLPVVYFDDRAVVRERLLGEHRAQREGRHAQVLRVNDCRVIPQPFGTLLSVVMDDAGRVTDTTLATGTAGIVDVGGKTTNLLSVEKLTEVSHETTSVDAGAWAVARGVEKALSEKCPELSLREHQLMDAITARQVKYFGEVVDLTDIVDAALKPLADQVVAAAAQLWKGGAALDAVIVTGGGALLVGPYIQGRFRHAQVVAEPVFANARGYWRFAQRLANR